MFNPSNQFLKNYFLCAGPNSATFWNIGFEAWNFFCQKSWNYILRPRTLRIKELIPKILVSDLETPCELSDAHAKLEKAVEGFGNLHFFNLCVGGTALTSGFQVRDLDFWNRRAQQDLLYTLFSKFAYLFKLFLPHRNLWHRFQNFVIRKMLREFSRKASEFGPSNVPV